jgi:AraC-like DNA-binding protein
MQALITQLHQTPLGRILDFKCRCEDKRRSAKEHVRNFSVSFTRQGSFGYHAGRRSYDIHSGVILLENAGCEYTVTHTCTIKDECTIIELADEFVEELKASSQSRGKHSILSSARPLAVLPTTPGLEFLHTALLHAAQNPLARSLLKIDALMLALLQEIGGQKKANQLMSRREKLKDHQLAALDQAKRFITANFRQELSLAEIARHSRVSIFYFSRLFKQFTSRSPYQFLIAVRLKHAALLMRHYSLPVTQICFESGFNSFEHFILSFSKHYGTSPSKYRRQKSKIP